MNWSTNLSTLLNRGHAVGALDGTVAGDEFDVVPDPVVDLDGVVVEGGGLGLDGGGELDVFGCGEAGAAGGLAGGSGQVDAGEAAGGGEGVGLPAVKLARAEQALLEALFKTPNQFAYPYRRADQVDPLVVHNKFNMSLAPLILLGEDR